MVLSTPWLGLESALEQIRELIGAEGSKDRDEPFRAMAQRECLGWAGQNTSF